MICLPGGKPSEGDDGALGGPKEEGRHTTLSELDCAYVEDSPVSCTCLNLIQYNTCNNTSRENRMSLYLKNLQDKRV
jgi:hypothetical protein